MIAAVFRTSTEQDTRGGVPQMRRPTICLVSPTESMAQLVLAAPNADIGGAEVQLSRIARLLSERGWGVSCVVPQQNGSPEVTGLSGVRIVGSYQSGPARGPLGWLTHKWPRLWAALRRADSDIYVTRGASWVAGAVGLYARLHGRKAVFWMASESDAAALTGNHLGLHGRICYSRGLKYTALIIAQTQAQRRLMLDATGRRAVVVPSIWLSPNGAAPQVDVDRTDALWVGNIRQRKRPMLALDVAERLPELRFTLVGGPVPGEEALHEAVVRRASELGNVSCVGHVPHDEVHAYYRAASILLHTSAVEGFPNVFLEAWGEQLPVVSTCSPDGVIERHRLGLVAHTPDGLAQAVRNAMAFSPEARQDIADWVRRCHGQDVVMEALEDALSSLIADELPGEVGGP